MKMEFPMMSQPPVWNPRNHWNLRLVARMVTEENAYKAFLDQAFLLFDP